MKYMQGQIQWSAAADPAFDPQCLEQGAEFLFWQH